MRPNSAGHIHLPHWWVKAFDWGSHATLGLNQGDHKDAWSQANGSGVLPALQMHEYSALASILSTLQQALIDGQTSGIKLRVDDHFKKAGSMARSRLFAYERVLQWLGSLAIDLSQTLSLNPAQTTGEGLNDNKWIPLVERARWIEDPQEQSYSKPDPTRGFWGFLLAQLNTAEPQITPSPTPLWSSSIKSRSLSLVVDLGPLGPELCFGLADAHVSLVRRAYAKHLPDLSGTPFKSPPLTLWRSLWLDLTPYETTLYLKLEKAMQWEFRWVDLDGVFGVSLKDFLEEKVLKHPQAYQLIQRFGRKLEQHGYLTQLGQMQHRLMNLDHGTEDSSPMLLWQASAQRILEDRASEFKHVARQVLLRPLIQGETMGQWLNLFAFDSQITDSLAYGREIWKTLTTVVPKVSSLGNPYQPLEFHDTLLWSPQSLFFEWTMRCRPTSRWAPLPEVLKSSPLGALVDDPQNRYGPVERRFEEFCLLLQDMPEICQILREIPFASLAAPITVNLIDWTQFHASIAPCEPKPASDMGLTQKTPQKETQPSSPQTQREKAEPTPKEDSTAPSGATLMRTAALELGQLERANQTQYQELRRSYLSSLDEIGQKLIRDVQQRMQPHVFEEHLRKRIIRFMVENPGVWSISQGPKAVAHSL